MAYPAYIKEKARQLRSDKQLTIDEIAERLAVSRTTVFYWVGDMERPRRCVDRRPPPAGIGSKAMQEKYRLLREEAYESGRRAFPRLASDPTFRDFVSLYIAEGYRRNRNVVSLGNSDPAVVKLANHWIKRFARNPVTYSLQFHADQSIVALRKFWAGELNAEPNRIRFQRKSNSGRLNRRTWRSKYGVITVVAHDTYFRARLQGWIDCMKEQWLDSLRPGRGAAW